MSQPTPAPVRRHAWRLLAVTTALLLLAFFVRAHRLGTQELRGDEGFSVHLARDGFAPALERILATGEPSMPLHVAALSAATALWGDGEFALRYPSLLASMLCVPLTLTLGRRLAGAHAGWWAGLFMALNPVMVWYAQDVRNMYPLMVLFTLLSSWFLWRAVHHTGAGAARAWALYALAAALGLYSHYYAAWALAAHGFWIVLFRRDRLLQYALAALGTLALLLPWAAAHLPAIIRYGPTGGGGQAPLPELAVRTMRALLWGDFLGGPAWPTIMVVAVVLAVGLTAVARSRGVTTAGWLALAALVPPVLALAVATQRTLFNEGYALATLPALLILAGAALAWRPAERYARLAVRAAGLVALIALAASLLNLYYNPAYSRTIGWRALRARVAAEATNQDVLVVSYPDPTVFYYVRGPLEVTVLPSSPDAEQATIARALDPVKARGGRVWWLPSDWDSRQRVRTYLDAGWVQVEDGWAGRQHLLVYAPPSWLDAHSVSLQADFGAGIRLQAYYAAPRIRPGDTVRLVLLWESLAPVKADYTVFTHLLAPDGSLYAGQDNPPVTGTRPTSGWRPGERILDLYALPVRNDAPPGEYVLQVGLYDPATGTRVQAGTADAVRLATIHVSNDGP